MRWHVLSSISLFAATACAKKMVEHDWQGISVVIPKHTGISNSGVSSPPPGVDDPNAIRPGIVLMRPQTHDYFIEIVKLPQPLSIEGLTHALSAQPSFAGVTHESRTGGNKWELHYNWRNPDGTVSEVFDYYLAFGTEQYQCTYGSSLTKDLALARQICLSIRPRR